MDFMRKYWTQIQAHLSHLSATQKWLIGMVLIVLALVGVLVVLYAGQPETIAIPVPADRQPAVTTRLQAVGINVTNASGTLRVPTEKLNDAMAVLAQDDLLAPDSSAAFDQLIVNQSPWMSNEQNKQAFLLAKQKMLGTIIARMRGVRGATVLVSPVENVGFGHTATRPSASVSVQMAGSGSMDKRLVDAVAGLVSGAVAGMQPQDVVVIDANQGRQYTVKSQEEMGPGENYEHTQALEQYHRDKIIGLLAYIRPLPLVAVNVQTDSIQNARVNKTRYATDQDLHEESSTETNRRDVQGGSAEPGARANISQTIDSPGGGTGSIESVVESRVSMLPRAIVETSVETKVGQTAKQINVSVNVPRTYFVGLFKRGKPADTAEPDDAALKPIADAELSRIQDLIKPIITTADAAGVVQASMYPDVIDIPGMNGPPGSLVGSGGVTALLESGLVKTYAAPAALVLLAIGVMFYMVRKTSQHPPMPTVEELAGVPPTLPADEDLVGEVDQSEPSLPGVELDENEIRLRNVAEQITQMVKNDPTEAARIVNRWVRTEE